MMSPDDVTPIEESRLAGLLEDARRIDAGCAFSDHPDPERAALRDCLRLLRPPAPAPGPEPWRLDRFEIREEIGSGGFGIVFRAHDPLLNRDVALKVPRPDRAGAPEIQRRFLREARAAASLEHPNIVPVLDLGPMGSLWYIASTYCDGPTLASWLGGRARPVPHREAARLIAALADAVEHAHRRGVLHRDIKPSNVLMIRSGAASPGEPEEVGWTPRLTDFGLARILEEAGEETQSGLPIGSPPYMAPEQARGDRDGTDRRSDVYSLGVVLYQMLTGEVPFRGTPRMVLRQVLEDDPRPPRRIDETIPRDLETVCLKAMAREPERRYPTAGALADDLRRFLDGQPVRARPLSWPGRLWRRCRRRPVVSSLAAGLAAAVLAGVAGTAWQAHRTALEYRRAEDALYETNVTISHILGAVKLSHERGRPLLSPGRLRALIESQRKVVRSTGEGTLGSLARRVKAVRNLGRLLDIAGRRDEALDTFRSAAAMIERLPPGGPEAIVLSTYLISVYDEIAGLRERSGEGLAAEGDRLRLVALAEAACRLPGRERLANDALARALAGLGRMYVAAGRIDDAERALARLEDLRRSRPTGTEPGLSARVGADLAYGLAKRHRDAGRDAEAADAFRRALALRGEADGPEPSPMRRRAQCNLQLEVARSLDRLGRTAEAIAEFRAACDRLEALIRLDPDSAGHRNTLADCCHAIGNRLMDLGQADPALASYRRALEIREALVRDDPGDPSLRRQYESTARLLAAAEARRP